MEHISKTLTHVLEEIMTEAQKRQEKKQRIKEFLLTAFDANIKVLENENVDLKTKLATNDAEIQRLARLKGRIKADTLNSMTEDDLDFIHHLLIGTTP